VPFFSSVDLCNSRLKIAGDAWQFMGDEERALEINPNRWNVVERLQRLEKSPEDDRI
jgi:hypothetical protein